jgi:hypothetical protein
MQRQSGGSLKRVGSDLRPALHAVMHTAAIDVKYDDSGGDAYYKPSGWSTVCFALSGTSIHTFTDAGMKTLVGTLTLTPDSVVVGTTLHPNSFQVVTPRLAIHIKAGSEQQRAEWMDAVSAAVASSNEWAHLGPAVRDRAFDMAMDEGVLYDVMYTTRKPLGMAVKQVSSPPLTTTSTPRHAAPPGAARTPFP